MMPEPPGPRLHRDSWSRLPTPHGTFLLLAYRVEGGHEPGEHLALVKGPGDEVPTWGKAPVLVRVHSECLTGDVFGSRRCDCGDQLHLCLHAIAERGLGVLIYLRQEGRGIGLLNKVRAYALQDRGRDTVEANLELGFGDDLRDYGAAARILDDLGVARVELLTNNPRKIAGLERAGIDVALRTPVVVPPNPSNRRYLETKRAKLGHLLGGALPRTPGPEERCPIGGSADLELPPVP